MELPACRGDRNRETYMHKYNFDRWPDNIV
jgi:hypothetical protein